jgi:excisionase family DNA binding protein
MSDLAHWLTIGEAAHRLHLSVRTVERLIASGELRSVKVHGARRVPVPELAAYEQRLLDGQAS